MKIISKRTGYLSEIEIYDLCNVYSDSELNKGLIICYKFSICNELDFNYLELKAKSEEIGAPEKWYKKYSKEYFESTISSLEYFLNVYDNKDLYVWTISAKYNNIEVFISGNRSETEIRVSYPKEIELDVRPLIEKIEDGLKQ